MLHYTAKEIFVVVITLNVLRREILLDYLFGPSIILRVLESERGNRRGSQSGSILERLSLLLMALRMKEEGHTPVI